MIAEAVLAIVTSLPVYIEDRAPEFAEAKREQSVAFSHAVADASDSPEMATMLVTLAWWETRLSLRIGAGLCKPHECDRGLARGLMQAQRTNDMTDADWDGLIGNTYEPLAASARHAARLIRGARRRCRSLELSQDWAAGVFSQLAGRGCVGHFKTRHERVAMFRRLLGKSWWWQE